MLILGLVLAIIFQELIHFTYLCNNFIVIYINTTCMWLYLLYQ